MCKSFGRGARLKATCSGPDFVTCPVTLVKALTSLTLGVLFWKTDCTISRWQLFVRALYEILRERNCSRRFTDGEDSSSLSDP